MAQLPKFKPQETPLANYQQGAVNWSFIVLKYGKPLGPEQKQYGPYYTYSIDVYLNNEYIPHRWYPSVDEHRIIQLAGAANGAKMAVTYVVDGRSKGLVALHQGGAKIERGEDEVDTLINQEIQALQNPAAQQGPISNVILPPEPPQFPAPATAPAPPTPPQPQQAQPPVAVPPTPPPQKQEQKPPQPPPKNGGSNGNREGWEPPTQRVYYPLKENAEYNDLMDAVLADSEHLRKKALESAMESLKEYFPAKPTNPQKLEMLRLAIDYSAPLNMHLRDKTWHMWLKPGEQWVLGKKPLLPDTKDNALELIRQLHPDDFRVPTGLIKKWLEYVAGPIEDIKAWQHAGNIAKLLGVDREVIINEFDVEHLVTLTKAIWMYEEAKVELDSRNEALKIVAKEYGLPEELMEFEPEDE